MVSSPVVICLLLYLLARTEGGFELLKNSRQKFMFQHSFKPPMIVNSKGQIPFWEHGGDALPTDEQVRVCPSIQDRKGWVWNKYVFDGGHWTFDATFSIAGRNTYGADGMVFWFVAERAPNGGTMFGSSPTFNGMAIVIDTFDNDQQGDSPKVSLYVSNKTLDYNHGTDGSNQELSYCLRQVRNQRYPTKIKVIYVRKTLEVWFQDGEDNKTENYNRCFKNDGIYLPPTGYFGISAATGGLSDDHDVMSFVVHKITTLEQEKTMADIDKAHAQRLEQYAKFAEEFEGKRKDKSVDKQEDWQVRLNLEENVRMIYDMQSVSARDVKILISKVNELALVKSTSTGHVGMSDDKITALEGRLSHHIQELKSHITTAGRGGGGGGGGGGLTASEQMQPLYELKENIRELKATIERVQESIQQEIRSSPCPEVAAQSCLSAGFFLLVIFVQSAAIIAFFVVKYSQERKAKKFF